MTATLSRPSPTNRIAEHLPPEPLPLPATPEEREEAWADALFAAVQFYRRRLAHPDADAAERAARALLDLEKTRLRHGRDLAGTPAPLPPLDDLTDLPPLTEEKAISMECDAMLAECDEGRGPADRVMTADEKEAAEAFAHTPLFETVVKAFQAICREDRFFELSRREAEGLAREFAVRRHRAAKQGLDLSELRK